MDSATHNIVMWQGATQRFLLRRFQHTCNSHIQPKDAWCNMLLHGLTWHHWLFFTHMMTSSNGNSFRVTGPYPRWIPRTKASGAGLWCFSLICARINGWVNHREAGDLRRHLTHCDVIVMRSYSDLDCMKEIALSTSASCILWALHERHSYIIWYMSDNLCQWPWQLFQQNIYNQYKICTRPSPERRQANIWTNDRILLIGTLGTNFNEILNEIHTFSFKIMHLKTSSSATRRPFCLGLNVLRSYLIGLKIFTDMKNTKLFFRNAHSFM